MTRILAAVWLMSGAVSPEDVVRRAIDVHGSERLRDAEVHFDFRGEPFSMDRKPSGTFRYAVETRGSGCMSGGPAKIVVSNGGTERFVDGEESPRWFDILEYMDYAKVNSVVYFASMPLPILDPAVQLHDAGTEELDGETLRRVRVTFAEKGGGADHEDEFMFWFRESDGRMAYLAYSYYTNGGGVRFRVPKNPREIQDAWFFDYDNYQAKDLETPLQDLLAMHREGKLEKVSEVLTENVCFSRLGEQRFPDCP